MMIYLANRVRPDNVLIHCYQVTDSYVFLPRLESVLFIPRVWTWISPLHPWCLLQNKQQADSMLRTILKQIGHNLTSLVQQGSHGLPVGVACTGVAYT